MPALSGARRPWLSTGIKLAAIDFEIHPEKDTLLEIGACLPDGRSFRRTTHSRSPLPDLKNLAEFCRGTEFIIGHNLVFHDLEWLRRHDPKNPLNHLTPVDTLVLAPLAFPRHPYHRLWKGYKPVENSRNNPVRDSACSLDLLEEQLETLSRDPLFPVYRSLLEIDPKVTGTGQFLGRFQTGSPMHAKEITRTLLARFGNVVCSARLRELPQLLANGDTLGKLSTGDSLEKFLDNGDTPEKFHVNGADVAFAAAWLSTIMIMGREGDPAGHEASSRLAPWVVHQFPRAAGWLDRLRSIPCGSCAYCDREHSAISGLKQFFGFSSFRPVSDNPPISQQDIVERILRREDLLLVLPTGGGKSLCFQLPALMLARRRKLLTLIISPLQSLMKDQVDALKNRGISNVGAISGLLNVFERMDTIEQVKMGDIDLLFVAPEQLRNESFCQTVRQREIGLIVIDEAHCLSKWGHDFRPDYLFICTFLKETLGPGVPLPPVACFTATAKKDVADEICEIFKIQAGKQLYRVQSNLERDNLSFYAHEVPTNQKRDVLLNLLQPLRQELIESRAGAIVFTSRRYEAESLAVFLQNKGIRADYFHGQRTPEEKLQVQDRFMTGAVPVICATNAFGMGVDKSNVRLVVHFSVPGSLENYLQEAGRAGRDRNPAQCHLIFDSNDLDMQFQMCSMSRIETIDLISIFRVLASFVRKKKNGVAGEIVKTTGEILRDDSYEDGSFEASDAVADTKVKIALAWLEKLGRVERTWNRTHMINARPRTETYEEAEKRVDSLDMKPREAIEWKRILFILFQAPKARLMNTDSICLQTGNDTPVVIRTLRAMQEANLIHQEMNLAIEVSQAHSNNPGTERRWKRHVLIEQAWIRFLSDAEQPTGEWFQHRVRETVSRLRERIEKEAVASIVDAIDGRRIRLVLESLAREGSLQYRFQGDDLVWIMLKRPILELASMADARRSTGNSFAAFFLRLMTAGDKKKSIEFPLNHLDSIIEREQSAPLSPTDRFGLIRNILLTMNDCQAIDLKSSLSVFRTAMTLKIKDKAGPPRKEECTDLESYFLGKNAQIHVMERYVQLAKSGDDKAARRYIQDYFTLSRAEFEELYFRRKKKQLELPVDTATWERILGKPQAEADRRFQLSPVQQQIISEGITKNLLVLAGPGSGKTRILVHRAAWLLKVKRAPPRSILVVAFNRSTVLEIRRRLKDLVGPSARDIQVYTYHGLALRVTDRSLAKGGDVGADVSRFDLILREAVGLLKTMDSDERDKLTGGLVGRLRYLLVDEYQDINELEYSLVALLARKDQPDACRKVHLLAVGDDDQNIYAFKGANVEFIRRFQQDYDTAGYDLLLNYRSTPAICNASRTFISGNADRLKSRMVLESSKEKEQGCGNEPVRLIRIDSSSNADSLVIDLLEKLRDTSLDSSNTASDIAVLSLQNEDISRIKRILDTVGIPCRTIRKMPVPLERIREFWTLFQGLREHSGASSGPAAGKQYFNASAESDDGELASDVPFQEMRPGECARIAGELLATSFQEPSEWKELAEAMIDEYFLTARHPDLVGLLEAMLEGGREMRLGEVRPTGLVTLSTMHSAKGLEFDTVILRTDGFGGYELTPEKLEALRRLLYVAMTRAKNRLIIICPEKTVACGDAGIVIDELMRLSPVETVIASNERNYPRCRLLELSLRDVDLSWLGRNPAHKLIIAALSRVIQGTEGKLVQTGDDWYIDAGGVHICHISKQGAELIQKLLCTGFIPFLARCMAVMVWTAQDNDPKYRDSCLLESWEVPLFELEFRKKDGS
ncbi:MAG: RecQ family ATP-dependent DNA helicase [Candidatus Riflebacteria bacterium]|nr:RecQ family ATP-dependent DNA helicase [Candidatus Riflebacteria bacterium]